MPNDTLVGRILVGVAFAAIGLVAIFAGHLPAGLIPLTDPLPSWLAMLLGVSFAASVAAAASGQMPKAALIGAAFPALTILLLHLPRLVSHSRDALLWSSLFQMLAITGGVLLLGDWEKWGRWLLVLALVGFGAQHFMYPDFIAGLIPAWMPARTALAWLTGLAFEAAALSFALQRYQVLAGRLLALMWISWVPILHLPRIAAQPDLEAGWTSGLIALGLGGVALLQVGGGLSLPTLSVGSVPRRRTESLTT